MSTINWDDLAKQAGNQTDQEFSKQLSTLVNVNMVSINNFIKASNISNQNAIKVLKEIHAATKSNEQKVEVISKIENGIGFLLQIATKIVV